MKTTSNFATLPMMLLSLACCVTFLPCNMPNTYLSLIAKQWGFSDVERDEYLGGWIAATTMVGQVVATLVAGLIVSKGVNRAKFIVCILALSMSNVVLFVHASFQTLLLLRLVMGVAQGAIIPVVFSMAADMYSPVDRPSASAILTGAVGAGMLCGQIFAGFMSGVLAWRDQIGLTGVLSFSLMCWCVRDLVDPSDTVLGDGRRSYNKTYFTPQKDKALKPQDHTLHPDEGCCSGSLASTCCIPTVALLLLQSMPSTIPWGVMGAFLVDFLTHEAALRMDVATAMMAAFGAGAALGGIGGGLIGSQLYSLRSKKMFCMFIGVATTLGAVGTQWMIRNGLNILLPSPSVGSYGAGLGQEVIEVVTDAVTDLGDLLEGPAAAALELDPSEHEARHFFLAALVVMLCGVLSAINGPNIKAMFLNLSPPAHRASLISWANFLNCVGRGIGPMLAKYYIVKRGMPRQAALEASVSMWHVSGVVLMLTAFTIDSDIFNGAATLTNNVGGKGGREGAV